VNAMILISAIVCSSVVLKIEFLTIIGRDDTQWRNTLTGVPWTNYPRKRLHAPF